MSGWGKASTVPLVARHWRKTATITMIALGRQDIFSQLLWLVSHTQLEQGKYWGHLQPLADVLCVYILQALCLGSFPSVHQKLGQLWDTVLIGIRAQDACFPLNEMA